MKQLIFLEREEVIAIDWASPFAKELLTYKKDFISGGRMGTFSVQ